ncbi:MAG: hypothetical protein EP344_07625 [Bacteroidetes bacterium]|nr:MAG: hypothetical protein EP344_07625 [Bacteroidota bacterium]
MKQLLLFSCLALFTAANLQPKPKKFKLPKAYVYVPSGTCTIAGESKSIQGFYMQATEVTNLEYREFLHDLQAQGRTADYKKARIRPEGWKLPGTYMEPMAEHYHQHPAYNDYPVVNITQEGARLYCEWLTEKLKADDPDAYVQVRLPVEAEWIYAAAGGKAGMPYPHGYYLRDSKGQFQYNFRVLGDEAIHRNPQTGEMEVRKNTDKRSPAPLNAGTFATAPARSYSPNDYGLYNTSGNVAEMLAEPGRTKGGCFRSTGYDIRIDAEDEFAGFTDASPFIGFRPVVSVVGKKEE